MNTNTAEFKRFLFDTTFEAAKPKKMPEEPVIQEVEPEVVEPEEPPVPTFSEEELIAARAEGFKTGKEEGMREAMEDSSRILAEIIQNVGGQIARLLDTQHQAMALAEECSVEVAMAVTKKLFPSLQEKHGFDEVSNAIKASFEKLLDEPKITVRAAPEHKEAIATEMKQVAEDLGFEGKIVVIADEKMNPGDCRVEWDSGGAERKIGTIWQEIDDIIERNTGPNTPDAPAEAPPIADPQGPSQTREPLSLDSHATEAQNTSMPPLDAHPEGTGSDHG